MGNRKPPALFLQRVRNSNRQSVRNDHKVGSKRASHLTDSAMPPTNCTMKHILPYVAIIADC